MLINRNYLCDFKTFCLMERRIGLGFTILVLFASGLVMSVNGKKHGMCKAKSELYKGWCLKDATCAIVCNQEGYEDGKCSRFRRKCLCMKQCGGGGGGGSGGGGGEGGGGGGEYDWPLSPPPPFMPAP